MIPRKVRTLVLITPLIASALWALSAEAQAQAIAAAGNPRRAAVTINSATDLTQPVHFYYVSKGNESVPLEVTLEGPGGIRGVVEMSKVRGQAQPQLVRNLPGRYQVVLDSPLRIPKTEVAFSEAAQGGTFPGGCTEEQYQLYLDLISSAPELSGITPEQFCAGFGGGDIPGAGGGDGSGGSVIPGQQVTSIGMLRKNACAAPNKSRYLVRLAVNLTDIDPAAVQAGAEIRATFRERNYTGTKASTIKPVSEGRFAPHPLLLMSSVSAFGERVLVTRWKNNRPRPSIELPVEDYVYYRGLVLTRSVVSSLLNGKGKATFEIMGGGRGYGVCFQMRRARQSRNGYPIGSDGA